jgi:ectoine hydroxylase-related dioxygenase (phytanoyl-CoA dioxygenase family)
MIATDSIGEIQARGFCVVKSRFPQHLVDSCRDAFWPVLLAFLDAHRDAPNRGPHRHFLPMPSESPCFAPEFFCDPEILSIVRGLMDDRIVADQWGCDISVRGSEYQNPHIDCRRPLFEEAADLLLPPYMLLVSFGLTRIAAGDGPIEIAPCTHRMPRAEALRAVQTSEIEMQPVPLELGDVLIRHPWALHRGTPNTTGRPRALVTIRYVRRWYTDDSREVATIAPSTWQTLTPAQQAMLRFPVGS